MAVRTIDEALLGRIDELELSDKLRQWKDKALNYDPRISADRLKLVMESWRETEGEDIAIRRAKALKKVCENIPIAIHDWQMLVGSDTEHLIAGVPYIDLCADYLPSLVHEERVALASPMFTGTISEEEREVFREAGSFFSGKTPGEHIYKAWESAVGTWYDDLVEAKGTIRNETLGVSVFTPIDYEKILAEGLRCIIREAEEHIQRFREVQDDDDIERLYFWQAAVIACEAVIDLARRYSELASEMAGREQDPERRRDLEEIANVCSWVPENRARTFHEAMQFAVFIRQGLRLEVPGTAVSPGRLDQYLLPYFEREIGDGSLTLERAAELIGNEMAFTNNEVFTWEATLQEGAQTSRVIAYLNLGGFKSNGEDGLEDGFNEVSYLILHAAGLLRCAEPHLGFRWTPDTPRWAWRKAIETNCRIGGGNPQFESEPHAVQFWTNLGVPSEAAHNLSGEDCAGLLAHTGTIARMTVGHGPMNVPLALDLALHNGVAPRTGKRLGMDSGDPRTFQTFEELLQAFKKQWEFMVRRYLWLGTLAYGVEARYARQPFYSSIVPGCLDTGKDMVCAGPQLMVLMDRGIVDTADSLTAVKKLVFDEKRLTMDELLDALDSNFEGERGEEIRQMCLAAPKYGNDIDEADFMLRDVARFSADLIKSVKGPEGGSFYPVRLGVTWHYFGGLGVAALPNGRKSGEPMYDGSLSPGQGHDKRGPTAVLRSAIKADYKDSLVSVMTQRFSATLMQSPEIREKLASLTETFLKSGGSYIQYNILDAEMLRDAQRHPERYKDLVVRVGGFSTYFVHLVKEIQDEIISRTEQAL